MKYFLTLPGEPEKEVTKAEFIRTERNCGFRSKFGDNEIATAGFSHDSGNRKTSGRVVYETEPAAEETMTVREAIQKGLDLQTWK